MRWLVALLLALNLGWLAWSQGALRPLGLGPVVQAEPERLQLQLHPQALRIEAVQVRAQADVADAADAAVPQASVEPTAVASEPMPSASAAPAASAPVEPASAASGARPAEPASAPPPALPAAETLAAAATDPADARCLQAGPFDAVQIEPVRAALAALPAGSWRIDTPPPGGRWMVHLGGLADADAVAERRAELRARGIDTDRPGAALEPGLSLGRFVSEAAAERARTELDRKGVHGTRVVQERRDAPTYLLRLPQADAALRQRLGELGDALAGKTLQDCR